MMGLPDGPKSFKIGLVVLIQYRLWETASHLPSDVPIAITLYAIASSLKMKNTEMKKRSDRRKHCAEPKIFTPPQTPFPGVQDGQTLISWRWSLPLPTNPVWWRSMHAILSFRGNRPTHKQTHRQDRLQNTVPLSLVCSVMSWNVF